MVGVKEQERVWSCLFGTSELPIVVKAKESKHPRREAGTGEGDKAPENAHAIPQSRKLSGSS